MQMCAHETYFDCPYFEQMQYVADAAPRGADHYVMTRDDRLPRKALYLIDASRHASGLTESRSPVRQPQFIPWFSLRLDRRRPRLRALARRSGFVRALMPGVRAVIEAFLARRDGDGLVRDAGGLERQRGDERAADQRAHALAAGVDAAPGGGAGGRLRRARAGRDAGGASRRELAAAATGRSGTSRAGSYADSPGGTECSELVQCLALLGGGLPARAPGTRGGDAAARRRGGSGDVHTAHYLFEAARLLGLPDRSSSTGSAFWLELRRQGLKTPIESAEPTRSDCHAWGSHPLLPLLRHAARHPARRLGLPRRSRSHRCSGRSSTRPAGSSIPRAARSWSISSRRAALLHGRVVPAARPDGHAAPGGGRTAARAGETRF